MKKSLTRYQYPLAPLLHCGRCGARLYGESQGAGRKTLKTYYGCSHRRKQSPRLAIERWHAPWIPADHLEAKMIGELRWRHRRRPPRSDGPAPRRSPESALARAGHAQGAEGTGRADPPRRVRFRVGELAQGGYRMESDG